MAFQLFIPNSRSLLPYSSAEVLALNTKPLEEWGLRMKGPRLRWVSQSLAVWNSCLPLQVHTCSSYLCTQKYTSDLSSPADTSRPLALLAHASRPVDVTIFIHGVARALTLNRDPSWTCGSHRLQSFYLRGYGPRKPPLVTNQQIQDKMVLTDVELFIFWEFSTTKNSFK